MLAACTYSMTSPGSHIGAFLNEKLPPKVANVGRVFVMNSYDGVSGVVKGFSGFDMQDPLFCFSNGKEIITAHYKILKEYLNGGNTDDINRARDVSFKFNHDCNIL